MRRNPDDEDILDMLIRYDRAGVDISELLESFGVSGEALEEQVGLSGFVPVPPALKPQYRRIGSSSVLPQKTSRGKKRLLLETYEPGMNVSMLAKKLKISTKTATGWLSEAGYFPDREGLIKSYKPGMSIAKLAREHGASHRQATRWLEEAGVYERVKGVPGPRPSPKKEALINAYEPGMNVTKLAREFGVGSSTAERWLKDSGVYEKIDPFEDVKKEVLDAYEPGMNITGLAKRFGVSGAVVRNWLKRAGLLRSKKISPLRKKVVSSYIPGMSASELARTFNVHTQTVIGWLQEEGIYVPSKKQGRPKKKR
jgi:transposase-like protein